MLDSLIALYFQLNHHGQDYEFDYHRGDFYREVTLFLEDSEIVYTFILIDEEKTIFSVRSGYGFNVFQSTNNTSLQNITRNAISAEEVLTGFEAYFQDSSDLREFLSNPKNIDLTYEKLDMEKNWRGNTWLVSLRAMYDDFDFTKDDIFASTNYSTLFWNSDASKFKHAVTPSHVREIRYSGDAIDVNGHVLFLAAISNGYFSVDQYMPSKEADSTLVYEGEFMFSELAEPEYCKIVITNLNKLPYANFKLYLGDLEITGNTPAAFLAKTDGSFQYFNLKETKRKKALKEFEVKIRETVSAGSLQTYLEKLRDLE